MALRDFQARFLLLCLSLYITIEGARCSTQEPEPESRHRYTGHHLTSKQISVGLILKLRPASVLCHLIYYDD